MTPTPLRTLRLLLTRLLPVTMVVSLFTTGLIPAMPAADTKATVSDEVQTLTEGVAEPGFSRIVDTGQPTQVVGFEWQGEQEGAVEVRAMQDGAWSDWLRVEGNPAEGPDADSPERRDKTTAGPIWVGSDVRKLESRVVEGSLPRVKLHALRSEEPKASGGTEPAGAAPAQPAIVSRAAWGADESYRSLNTGYGCETASYASSVEMAVVHHTASPTNYTSADSASYMRSIYHFHTHTNNWCDIGYNFLVDRFGTVFEGRFGGITRPVVGAHALNFNTGSTGVALLGTFSSDAVPSPMYNGLRSLLAWKLSIHGVDPDAVITFNGQSLSTISGHRDVNATDCPGDMPHGLLPQLRDELADQVVVLPPEPGQPSPAGPRHIMQSALSGHFTDVAGGSRANGANVVQWPENGGLNQQWTFQEFGSGSGMYAIVSVNSGLVLDVNGASDNSGARVIQWPWNGGLNQLWYVHFFGDPSGARLMVIQSMSSTLVLDVNGGSTAPGTNLIQWPWNGGANQFWWRYPV